MATRTIKSATKPGEKPAAKAKPAAKREKAPPAASVIAKPFGRSAANPAAKTGAVAFKLKDLVDAVVASTGGKKPEVKKTVEATLAALSDALKRGADLNLPPLGRARVAKVTEKNGTSTLTLKLRVGGAAGQGAKQGLADVSVDS